MQILGAVSLAFLGFILIVMPVAALRSGRQLRRLMGDGGRLPAEVRVGLMASTLILQVVLFAGAWLTAHSTGGSFFNTPPLQGRHWLAAAGALAVLLLLRQTSEWLRPTDERRGLLVNQLVPRNRREWVLWVGVSVAAGIAEEFAYRGVAMNLLESLMGHPGLAALLCAIAFAGAHAAQGLRSGVVIFLMALAMHALVAYTGTLVLAMGVHTLYDLIAGWWISREPLPQARPQ